MIYKRVRSVDKQEANKGTRSQAIDLFLSATRNPIPGRPGERPVKGRRGGAASARLPWVPGLFTGWGFRLWGLRVLWFGFRLSAGVTVLLFCVCILVFVLVLL